MFLLDHIGPEGFYFLKYIYPSTCKSAPSLNSLDITKYETISNKIQRLIKSNKRKKMVYKILPKPCHFLFYLFTINV